MQPRLHSLTPRLMNQNQGSVTIVLTRTTSL
jgi:hypothetical protein